MQTSRTQTRSKKNRRGFTLIELLVVITIIATIMSLLLPAIQNARAAARNLECKNNLKQLALAASNFATAKRGQLPPLGTFNDGGSPGSSIPMYSWVVDILPYIERQDIYDRWQTASPYNFNNPATGVENGTLGQTYIKALACPDDATALGIPGGLTYVANGGYLCIATQAVTAKSRNNYWTVVELDWNLNTGISTQSFPDQDTQDSDLHRNTGVFWQAQPNNLSGNPNQRTASKNSHSLESIYDGTSHTIMFSENINAGGSGTWADPGWQNVGFVAIINTPVGASNSFKSPQLYDDPATPRVGETSINAWKNAPEATTVSVAAGANSGHPQGVNAAFADGSVHTLSQNIDTSVYLRLMSPAGSKVYGGNKALSQDPLSEDSF